MTAKPRLFVGVKSPSKRMANTLFIGKVYHRFDEIASTNDYARELLAKSKPPEGTVIRAASQSAGRGQYGSRWLSAPGENLLLSIILYPTWLAASDQFRLSEAVALAVLDAVRLQIAQPQTARPQGSSLLRACVKWPNDIYLDDWKTAGILIQNTLSGNFLQSSIVGIGLNVNQREFSSEATKATSLHLATGEPTDLDALADTLFACVEQRYLQLKSGNASALQAEYHRNLYGLGEMRSFARADGSRFEGMIQGVADDGRLVVRTDGGKEEMFGVKEVIWR